MYQFVKFSLDFLCQPNTFLHLGAELCHGAHQADLRASRVLQTHEDILNLYAIDQF